MRPPAQWAGAGNAGRPKKTAGGEEHSSETAASYAGTAYGVPRGQTDSNCTLHHADALDQRSINREDSGATPAASS